MAACRQRWHAVTATGSRRAWLWLLVPALAVFELILHFYQTRPRTDEADYAAASTLLKSEASPRDLVVFAPLWTDPIGRRAAASWLDGTRAFYTENARFERIFEVSRDGATLPEFASMPVERTLPAGALLIRQRRNPNYLPVVDDLLTHMSKSAEVYAARSAEQTSDDPLQRPCAYAVASAQAGPWDPAKPKGAYNCGSQWVAPIVLVDGSYRARYCMFATGPDMVLRFQDVHFGKELVTQLGFQRSREQRPGGTTTIKYRIRAELPNGTIEMRTLGEGVHTSGQPWSEFRIATPLLDSQTGDLFAEIHGNGHVCFEGTTR
jgi:hypothetical protein